MPYWKTLSCAVLALCAAFAVAPVARPVYAQRVPAPNTARADIVVHLKFSGSVHYAATLTDSFVMPTNQSVANDSCGVWSRGSKYKDFWLSVRFDQIQPYSSPVAASGLRIVILDYSPKLVAYTFNPSIQLSLRANNHDYQLLHDNARVTAHVTRGGASGSFVATHYSLGAGPGNVTIKGDWTCARFFSLKKH